MKNQNDVLKVFNSVVLMGDQKKVISTKALQYGVVTDFIPDNQTIELFSRTFKPIAVNTLFTVDERRNSSIEDLLLKQILHYVEVYGLNQPGLFDLTVSEGVIVKPCFVRGITYDELANLIYETIYANKPIKHLDEITNIIREFEIHYDINKVLNNEIKIHLFNPYRDKFESGDDVIRYIVYKATGNTLVIKNKKTYAALHKYDCDVKFLQNNAVALSQVFNRFKPIILSLKNSKTRSIINKISRMSKNNHVPVQIGINKIFVSKMIKAISDGSHVSVVYSLINKLSIRDKFKILNYLEYKALGRDVDAFAIRNGSMFFKPNAKKINHTMISTIQMFIIDSLKVDFAGLRDKKILLDSNVDYGLPISEKQTLGNLPFGTKVTINGKISSGIYWENKWGATDLDLSIINENGVRMGWGDLRSYTNKGVLFSGDITYAENGAMEFFTSRDKQYGLFVNIFSGDDNAGFELVVGNTDDKKWINNCVIREKSELVGCGSIIGFVRDNVFTVYQGKLSNTRANFSYDGNPALNKVNINYWTVKSLLDRLGIQYDTEDQGDKYDIDLTYTKFSLDKLNFLL